MKIMIGRFAEVGHSGGEDARVEECRDCVGTVTDITWKDVRVGQVVQVNDDELFPADLMCLYSALPDRLIPDSRAPPNACSRQSHAV